MFLAALGSLQQFEGNSGFQIIEEFCQKTIFNSYTCRDLSLALAVACHIRLFHYMSIQKQDDIFRRETESLKGNEKLNCLTQIVGIFGLSRCLVVSFILQEWFRKGEENLQKFDRRLRIESIPESMKIWNMLGLYREVIDIGEHYLNIRSQFDVLTARVLDQLGYAYEGTMDYQKSLEIYKTYVPQDQLQLENNFFHGKIKCSEQSCLLALGKYERVMIETNAMLKMKLKERDQIQDILQLIGESKFFMRRYHEALSAMRDLFRLNKPDDKNWDSMIEDSGSMECVALSLIGLGRKEQGIHWAFEGLNFVEQIGAASEFYKRFTNIIETFKGISPE